MDESIIQTEDISEDISEDITIIDKCSICHTENININEICKTNCNHLYCKECLDTWLNRGNIDCPMCRGDISEYEYNNYRTKLIPITLNRNNNNNNINNTNNNNSNNNNNNIIENINTISPLLKLIKIQKNMLFLFGLLLLFYCYSYYSCKNSIINLNQQYNTLQLNYNNCLKNITNTRSIVVLYNNKFINCYMTQYYLNKCI